MLVISLIRYRSAQKSVKYLIYLWTRVFLFPGGVGDAEECIDQTTPFVPNIMVSANLRTFQSVQIWAISAPHMNHSNGKGGVSSLPLSCLVDALLRFAFLEHVEGPLMAEKALAH
jgi:hypothetical protein